MTAATFSQRGQTTTATSQCRMTAALTCSLVRLLSQAGSTRRLLLEQGFSLLIKRIRLSSHALITGV